MLCIVLHQNLSTCCGDEPRVSLTRKNKNAPVSGNFWSDAFCECSWVMNIDHDFHRWLRIALARSLYAGSQCGPSHKNTVLGRKLNVSAELILDFILHHLGVLACIIFSRLASWDMMGMPNLKYVFWSALCLAEAAPSGMISWCMSKPNATWTIDYTEYSSGLYCPGPAKSFTRKVQWYCNARSSGVLPVRDRKRFLRLEHMRSCSRKCCRPKRQLLPAHVS